MRLLGYNCGYQLTQEEAWLMDDFFGNSSELLNEGNVVQVGCMARAGRWLSQAALRRQPATGAACPQASTLPF